MRAASCAPTLRAPLLRRCGIVAAPHCPRPLSSTTEPPQKPAAQPATTAPTPLIRPFHPSHLDTPTWSTCVYLPSPASPPPVLPRGLVQRLASLAYLHVPASALPQLERDIAAMIGHISYIRHTQCDSAPIYSPLQLMTQLDTDGEQGAERADGGSERVGVLSRTSPDVVSDGGNAELVLRNARYTNRGFYVVPKVVDLDV